MLHYARDDIDQAIYRAFLLHANQLLRNYLKQFSQIFALLLRC